ncbi:hypothetical protein [Senegalia massiliensis]|uniref:hypothetical protein n=1 Tax=Senegalia massiliensis TaxID=1720316 RepID=UPI00136380BB|nr:hypothetical protein [Senegalia massiliensis]
MIGIIVKNNKYKLHDNKRIAIVCHRDEQHELGAGMITYFFILVGYNNDIKIRKSHIKI